MKARHIADLVCGIYDVPDDSEYDYWLEKQTNEIISSKESRNDDRSDDLIRRHCKLGAQLEAACYSNENVEKILDNKLEYVADLRFLTDNSIGDVKNVKITKSPNPNYKFNVTANKSIVENCKRNLNLRSWDILGEKIKNKIYIYGVIKTKVSARYFTIGSNEKYFLQVRNIALDESKKDDFFLNKRVVDEILKQKQV